MSQLAYSYVRMSTKKQMGGTSLQRQVEQSKRYADERGWTLDEKFTLHDLGVSSFKGQNVKKGELGKFLVACEEGVIEKGSILIVESLDRISRQDPLEAMMLFREILKHGITISTFHDRQDYTLEKLKENPSSMFMSLGVLIRAFEESKTKSLRIADVWERRRISGLKSSISGNCPYWLKPNQDKTAYEVIEERAEVVRRVFNMLIAGFGYSSICKKFNADGIKPFSRRNKKTAIKDAWRVSYIQYMVKTRTVLGEWQPHQMKDGKRVPVGDPITDYYPSVIDLEIYLKAKKAIQSRRMVPTTTGKNISNPFRGLMECSCGGKIFINATTWKNKTYNYYSCLQVRSGLCTRKTKKNIKLEIAMSNMFVAIAETSSDFLVVKDAKQDKRRALELEDLIKTSTQKINTMLEMMFENPSDQTAEFIKAKQSEVDDWSAELRTLKEAFETQEVSDTKEALRELAEALWEARFVMDEKDGEALLSQRLKNVIRKVVVEFDERIATLHFHGGQTKEVDVNKLNPRWLDILSDYEDSLPDYVTENRTDEQKNWLV